MVKNSHVCILRENDIFFHLMSKKVDLKPRKRIEALLKDQTTEKPDPLKADRVLFFVRMMDLIRYGL